MSLLVNTGAPRQGKTMYAVAVDVVDALGRGQTVCGNIEGWGDPERVEKLRRYVIKAKGLPADFAIDLRFIPHSLLVAAPRPFPYDTGTEDEHGTRVFSDDGALVPFGSLLVWDEAEKFTTDQMPKAFKEVITYHGHWDTEKHPFNILLIYQHWAGLAPIVRANAEIVRLFKKKPNGKKFSRWTFHNPGDVPKLPVNSPATVKDVVPLLPAVGETYKSTRAEVVANDNVKTGFFGSLYAKKKIRLILILGVVTVILQYYFIGNFIEQSGADFGFLGGEGDASAEGQAVATAAGTLSSSSSLPAIVGVLPTEVGLRVMIQDGSEFVTVDGRGFTGTGRRLRGVYKGREIAWRDAM